MAKKLIAAPGAEPITLAEAKLMTRATSNSEDTLFAILIAAAREECENELGRALITQTWDKYLDAFPDGIELPMPPVQSITSVKYVDLDGTLQTLAASEYYLDDKQEPGWLVPAYGKGWPPTRDQANAVIVRCVCGYGADGTVVPQNIRNWMLVRINTLYEHRATVMEGGVVAKLDHVDSLLDRYRVAHLP